jgi:two-component system LytT family response regulator
MPGGSGLGVAAGITLDPRPVVIFVTAYDDYALKAFELHAVDYLLKPLDDDRFIEALAHAKQRVSNRNAQQDDSTAQIARLIEQLSQARETPSADRERILIKSSGEILILRADEVDWIEADGDYMKFHVAGKAHLMRETMSKLEERLDPRRFVRIHRSMIVNIDRVKKLSPVFGGEYAVILRDGTSLKLSRGYQERLAELLRQAL